MSEQLFKSGFSNLDHEQNAVPLKTQGRIPYWLNGTLFRNGPAKFSANENLGWHTHWFDGLAMLHKFSFCEGNVIYSNRYLRSNAYYSTLEKGQFNTGFGSKGGTRIKYANNTNINVAILDDRFMALSETPGIIEFNPVNLETVDVFNFDDSLGGQLTTAHPHYDLQTGRYINFTTEFGRKHAYNLYSVAPHSRKRDLIASVRTDRPAYMHSFANTENYVIITEFPLVIDPRDLANEQKTLIENFTWKPDHGTLFRVVRKSDGIILKTFEAEAFFSFHHVNAFEINGGLVLDICALEDAKTINHLQVSNLKGKTGEPIFVQLRRYTVKFDSRNVSYEVISPASIDLPRINYGRYSGKSYRYAYGISTNKDHYENYPNQLAKADLQRGTTTIWRQDGCYPGEPIFVQRPNSSDEDDGVVLSVVLDGRNSHSFLLVLDAQTFEELGRADVTHHIPFGFHGIFTGEQYM
ncbi:carotenoid oxygenase family protein [Paenibacillus lignilyticus]|uniref:Carotenoid oxygenase family protein n=1 Tax=Paenibacillus lignilyticus TaxID=1172615 RepID=A0ABS5CCU3_9BACL|nr:carotenoid oxygenase family protein [Paenibacillus lignilyticus]MBP3962938.1 carotenoid oxygenase family protein [Paenibacillus lignilyticus]